MLKNRFAVDRYQKPARQQLADRQRVFGNGGIKAIQFHSTGYVTTVNISGDDGENVLKEACDIYFRWLNEFSDLREVFKFT